MGSRRDYRTVRKIRQAVVEALEARQLLAAAPYISEFLASNPGPLVDQDGDKSDWIEIANPSPTDLNLKGYFLTTDPTLANKWQFPDAIVPGGGYLVVFASHKNITTGPELHTDFALAVEGEYLALVGPDGSSILSEYKPTYPTQLSGVSYGVATQIQSTPLVGTSSMARAYVPVDGSLGDAWKAVGFNDSGWAWDQTGLHRNAVGFDAYQAPPPVSGFTTRMVDVVGAITTIDTAQSILNTPNYGGYTLTSDLTIDDTLVNYGTAGYFGSGHLLPNGQSAADEYVLRCTANVFIPAGTWTIDVGSDDGFMLKMPGVSFSTTGTDTLVFAGPRSFAHTYGTITVPAPGVSAVMTLDYFENGGNDDLELSIASGANVPPGAAFSLLSDGVLGWSVKTSSSNPSPDYKPLIGVNLQPQMLNHNSSAYIRIPLGLVENPADIDSLRMRIKYDDGFIAYLNGREVARRNAPDVLAWNSSASRERPDKSAIVDEEISIAISPDLLNAGAGTNVLAIQGLNVTAADDDFLIVTELDGIKTLSTSQQYFSNPTPGAPNDEQSFTEIVADTKFSQARGFYDSPFSVEVTTATQGAQIRYTLDGSAPTATTGLVYSGPVPITTTTVLRAAAFKAGAISSNVDTETYLFLNDVIHQPANPAGFPAIGSTGVHWDYEMDPNVVSQYGSTIIDDLRSIPTMSLVMNMDDMFGPNGIYVNPSGEGFTWERPLSVEYILPDGSTGFQIDAGVRIYGGVNRSTSFPKHTFRLFFRNMYGEGKLKYPLFEGMPDGDSATDTFNSIILRGEFNNSWPFWVAAERARGQYIQDRWMSATQIAMGQPGTHGNFVHLYINGLYWGLYSPTERPDADFQASYLGGTSDDYDTIHDSFVADGTKSAWDKMQQLAQAGLSTPEAYAEIQKYVDVDNLIDYFILNIYGGNQDWDDHNWYAGRKQEDGAGFKFFNWDGERTLEDVNHDRTGVNQWDKPSYIYNALRANAEFRLRFADHVYQHFFNDGALTPENAAARYMEWANIIDRAIVGESARWGDFCESQAPYKTYTRDVDWVAQRDWEINTYFPARTASVLSQLRAAGLYPSVDAPSFSQHGGTVSPGFALTMSGSGQIWYTLDGSDPRLPGGGVAPGAILYTGDVAINDTATVKARALSNGEWSALDEATFTMDLSKLRVTEIMYNPAPPPAGSPYGPQDFEFIELQNTGSRELNLTGVTISGTIDYAFAPGTKLAAGARLVLVRNPLAFASRYPGVAYHDAYVGGLDNGDGRIRLSGPNGTLLDFTYRDGWFPITDGGGYSLVVVDPNAAPAMFSDSANWRASTGEGGDPGSSVAGYRDGAVVINEVMSYPAVAAGEPLSSGQWIELYNTTSQRISLEGWFLSNDPADLRKYTFPAGMGIDGNSYLIIRPADFGFEIAATGGDLFLSGNNGTGVLGGYREHVDFGTAAQEVTFGRYIKSTGGSDFTALSAPTKGSVNGVPLVGPVTINEIMYHPLGTTDAFVELYNITGSAVPLDGWALTEGVLYNFPLGSFMPAFSYALVVGIDPNEFRFKYGIPASVPIFGPWTDKLSNDGENVKLARLDAALGPTAYVTVDQVHYQDTLPWPTTPDGLGPSLSRIAATSYGNDAANWIAGPMGGTPGTRFERPAAPAELSATTLSTSAIRLSWLDQTAGEDGFKVERSTDGINFTIAGTAAANASTFDCTGLSPGTFYTFRVRAYNAAGYSGYSNSISARTQTAQTLDLITIGDTWFYNQSRTDPGTSWMTPTYQETGWLSGAGLLVGSTRALNLPAPQGTALDLKVLGVTYDTPAFYFRKHFTLNVDPSTLSSAQLRIVVDDGAAIYLNGTPLQRINVPTNSSVPVTSITRSGTSVTVTTASAHSYAVGEIVQISGANQWQYNGAVTITSVPSATTFTYTISSSPATPATGTISSLRLDYGTYASRTVGDATWEGPFNVPLSALRLGDNVLAVEVHQTNYSSSDLVWGATLQATSTSAMVNADIVNVVPDPSGGPIDSIAITFSEPVDGFDIGDLRLTRGGSGNLLGAAQTLTTVDRQTWTLNNLAAATAIEGTYLLQLTANGSAIIGRSSGRAIGADAIDGFTVLTSVIRGTSGDDSWTVRVNGTSVDIFSGGAAQPTYSVAIADLSGLTFDGGAGNDTLRIIGDLPFAPTFLGGAGTDRLAVDGGGLTISEDLAGTAGIEDLAVGGNGRVSMDASQHLRTLSLSGFGQVLFAGGGLVIIASGLSFADDAVLDLADGSLILKAADSAAAEALLAMVSEQIARGRNSGAIWQGNGIRSSAAAHDALRGVGVIRNVDAQGNALHATFGNEAIDANAVLVAYAMNGDADLNGILDGSDYFFIDKGFLSRNLPNPPSGYRNGDFDYNGLIDGSDYFLIDKAFLGQRANLSAPAAASAGPAFSKTRIGAASRTARLKLLKHGRHRKVR